MECQHAHTRNRRNSRRQRNDRQKSMRCRHQTTTKSTVIRWFANHETGMQASTSNITQYSWENHQTKRKHNTTKTNQRHRKKTTNLRAHTHTERCVNTCVQIYIYVCMYLSICIYLFTYSFVCLKLGCRHPGSPDSDRCRGTRGDVQKDTDLPHKRRVLLLRLLGFRVQGFKVLGFGVQGLEFQGLGFYSLGFRVEGSGLRVQGCPETPTPGGPIRFKVYSFYLDPKKPTL